MQETSLLMPEAALTGMSLAIQFFLYEYLECPALDRHEIDTA